MSEFSTISRVTTLLRINWLLPEETKEKKEIIEDPPKRNWKYERDHPEVCKTPIGYTRELTLNSKLVDEMDKPFYLMKVPQVIYLIGMNQSGKSTTARSILKAFQSENYFYSGLVITTTGYNNDWDCFPQKDVWDGSDPKIEERLLEYFNLMDKQANQNLGNVPPSVLIFDDLTGILGDNKADKMIKNVSTRVHHLNIVWIISSQRYTGANTTFRENTRLAILHQSNSETNTWAAKKDFGRSLPIQYKKKAVYDELVSKVCFNLRALLFSNVREDPKVLIFKSNRVRKHAFKMFSVKINKFIIEEKDEEQI